MAELSENHQNREFPDLIPGRTSQAKLDFTILHGLMRSYADSHGYQLNHHQPTLLRELEALLYHLEQYGYLYCPCRINDITGDLVRDKRLSCPCAYHVREIQDVGYCKCEIFVTPKGDLPDLISTTIHRLKVQRRQAKEALELLFEKEGWIKGEVKIYYPPGYRFTGIEVESENDFEVSGEMFEDGVLFFCFGFRDKAVIKLRHFEET